MRKHILIDANRKRMTKRRNFACMRACFMEGIGRTRKKLKENNYNP